MTGSHVHPSTVSRTLLLMMLACALLILVPSLALGQLTDDDIETLKQRGIEEGWTFTVGKNAATEYPLEQLCGLRVPDNWESLAPFDPCPPTKSLPDTFDWRVEVDGLPPIRGQGGCGSCWAFGTMGPLECNIKIQDGIIENLSEQYLVSCNSSGWGCDGGWWAHSYHIDMPDPCGGVGAVMEVDFPYVANDAPCGCPYPHPYKLASWSYIGSSGGIPDVNAMKQAIMDYGPISVGIHSTSTMQAYNGGIFNSCEEGDINHAVTIVGWQDMYGSGVWIVRNSWGSFWGEGGYMRLPYYCSEVGYGAAYVVYEGGLGVEMDTTYGEVPLTVEFSAHSGLEVDLWSWDFGDGATDDQPICTHTYTEPGLYDVTAEIEAGAEVRTRYLENQIAVLADTIWAEPVTARAGESFSLQICTRNHVPLNRITIPVHVTGDVIFTLDSVSTSDGRADNFDESHFTHWDTYGGRYTFEIFGTDPTDNTVPAGEGVVASLFFTMPETATEGQSTTVEVGGYSTYEPLFTWPRFEYVPAEGESAVVTVEPCCIGMTGNVDGSPDDQATISDLTKLVNHMFTTFEPLPCPKEANMNGDPEGNVDISDLQTLVDHLFISFWDMAYCQ